MMDPFGRPPNNAASGPPRAASTPRDGGSIAAGERRVEMHYIGG